MFFKITADKSDTGNNSNRLNVEVTYNKGGYSYATNRSIERGYYLSVLPERKEGICVSFIGFSGIKGFVEAAARKSAKRLTQLNCEDTIRTLVEEFNIKSWASRHGYEVDWSQVISES